MLYSVTLDSWDPNEPWSEDHPELPPPELTYRDAQALYASDIPDRKVMMRKAAFVVEAPPKSGVAPFLVEGRTTTKDFFRMFDVPFQYGGGWDQAADDASQMVVVLSKKTNDKAFGGAEQRRPDACGSTATTSRWSACSTSGRRRRSSTT